MTKGAKGLDPQRAKVLAEKLEALIRTSYPDYPVKMSQTAVAKSIGISQPQLSAVLSRAGRGFGINSLIRLREHFRISIDELLDLRPFRPRAPDDTVERQVEVAIARLLPEALRRLPESEPPPEPKLLPPKPPKKRG